ncbi:hypothetical protein GCM10011504_48700 [Siccirubricoccus deserti]|uniref:Alpha/beta fold hydrolase n=1 Tax=Siccirubricoccus deserti TaxID=2013562 RepID=A0A9X0R211_9PROT|nr:prolyl oligopeptidase family serine peptidase [Siccirubricoccus deserti]MBC4018276.1 alpha/beta fold hydrolase [Siccirubricoccus deserti]GGC64912.1 hypothetical protein GCM10011504_48700 [Siccirubricoccus deserti]
MIGIDAAAVPAAEEAPAAVHVAPVTLTSGGEPIRAVLYQLDGGADRPRPAVVLSPPRLRTIEQLDWLARALAARGIVVLAQAFRNGASRYQLRDVEDVCAAVSWLTGLPGVDAARIGAVGHSRGGSASLRAAAADVRIRSTVALAPPTDVARYVRGLQDYAPSRYRTMVAGYGATPDEEPDYYRAISPIAYADRIRTPVFLVHGTLDLIAPHEHSEWMRAALLRAGNARVRLELVEGMGHFFELGMAGYQFVRIAGLAAAWFEETLG